MNQEDAVNNIMGGTKKQQIYRDLSQRVIRITKTPTDLKRELSNMGP